MEQEMNFETWYAIFVDHCRAQGYKGPIDADSATNDYNDGLFAQDAAQSFVKEMNE